MDQQPYPLASQVFPEKHRSNAKRNHELLMRHLAKERQEASKAASSPTVPPNSYSTRIDTFTSWPHSNPSASVMAMAGFHQVHVKGFNDKVECSGCHISLSGWNRDGDGKDNPLMEHISRSTHCCPFFMTKSKPPVEGSAPPKHNKTPTASVKSPSTSTTATTTAVEMPLPTKKKSLYAKYYIVSSAPRDAKGKLLGKKPKDAPAKPDALPSPMETIMLGSEEWVDLGFEGEEKDGWIEV